MRHVGSPDATPALDGVVHAAVQLTLRQLGTAMGVSAQVVPLVSDEDVTRVDDTAETVSRVAQLCGTRQILLASNGHAWVQRGRCYLPSRSAWSSCLPGSSSSRVACGSSPEYGADIPVTHRRICEPKRAVRAHFSGSAQKRPKRGTGERTANADAFHPQLAELGESVVYAL